jgi:4-amino-4-deoxy-L-arabinose transferase-like glycosyltransferase
MARHILQGERPIFFYGQAYMGSLDAWLVAGAFAVVGPSVLAIRLVQTGLYLGIIATTYALGLKIYRRAWIAGAAAVFLAIPVVLLTLYTTASLGGYGETLLLGNLVLWLAMDLGETPQATKVATWLALGFVSGLGYWTFPLIGVYLLPAAGHVVVRRRMAPARWRQSLLGWGLLAAGFVVGAAPWLWFTFTSSPAALSEMFGSAIAGASPANPVFAAFGHFYNFLLLGLTVIAGLRPPWGANFLALPLAPFELAILTALTLFILRRSFVVRDAARPKRFVLVGQVVTLVAVFVLTPFGADPSGRYFLPLLPVQALFLAEMLYPGREWEHHPALPAAGGAWLARGRALALGVVLFNWWGTVQCAAAFPPGITTQFAPNTQVDQRALPELMAFLRAQGETRGYTNYWVEFPLAFLSNDELLFAARLPYHLDFQYTPRYDRYLTYSQAVAASPRVAYLTSLHTPLDERLRTGFASLGVTFQEKQIGDFHVFYALSRKVTPQELGLGEVCCDQ